MAKLFINKLFSRPHNYLITSFGAKNFSTNVETKSEDVSSSNSTDLQHEEYALEYEPVYEEHIPTSLLQKALLTVGSSILSITNPYRHDMVAVLGETTGYKAAQQIREKMMNDPEGSSILKDRPRINSNTLDYQFLESLPSGTFGHAYVTFLKENNVTPDTRRPVHYVDDAEIAYIIQRYREVHDLNHALLGMPTNMLGEVAVKWIESIQTGLPMCTAGALLGPVRFRTKQRQKYLKSYLPWAVSCGQQAKFLMNVYFEKRWQQDLNDLRKELNIPDFPVDS